MTWLSFNSPLPQWGVLEGELFAMLRHIRTRRFGDTPFADHNLYLSFPSCSSPTSFWYVPEDGCFVDWVVLDNQRPVSIASISKFGFGLVVQSYVSVCCSPWQFCSLSLCFVWYINVCNISDFLQLLFRNKVDRTLYYLNRTLLINNLLYIYPETKSASRKLNHVSKNDMWLQLWPGISGNRQLLCFVKCDPTWLRQMFRLNYDKTGAANYFYVSLLH